METTIPGVRFIHDSQLGISIGYIVLPETIDVAISFTHKPGPGITGRALVKVDNFSRKTGRAITSARLKHVNARRGPPYTHRVKISRPIEDFREFDKQIRSTIYGVIDDLSKELAALHLAGAYKRADKQVNNSALSSAIRSALTRLGATPEGDQH